MTHKDSVERCMMIRGARVVTPGRDLGVANVRVEGGRIAAVGADARPAAGDEVIDADGLTLLPGFVDIHSTAAADATSAMRPTWRLT